MRPKFEVGEVVLLRSVSLPQENGEYVVEGVLKRGEIHGDQRVVRGEFGYILFGNSGLWAEQALRKKHQPGEMSFDSLMASLSSPKLLTHQPEGVAPL